MKITGVSEAFPVPAHIEACAAAVRYDLTYGPAWTRIPQGDVTQFTVDDFATFRDDVAEDAAEGDVIEEVYVGAVADALREFIDSLPAQGYADEDGDYIGDAEPEGCYLDADGDECESDAEGAEYCEPAPYYSLSASDFVEALFGSTIAREFR